MLHAHMWPNLVMKGTQWHYTDHTCQSENFISHSSGPLPPTARILSYLVSAQKCLTGEPQENIRKPVIAILTQNSAVWGSLPDDVK